tara:strand:+ start:1857 stop:4220 length:2364 start_codon:yes stop_codon:yes gene_type:complete
MANETGSIEIGVKVNSQEAVKGLEKVQDALNGTGTAAGSMGKEITQAAKQTTKETQQASTTTVKANKKAQDALRGTGVAATEAAKQRRQAGDTKDEIAGLDSLKDSTGELDSGLKGLAGAVGVVSPELEILLMRTGDLSGGLEAGARLTSLFGGSMGSLLRVLGPVTVAVTGVFFAYNKLSGGLKEAEDNLKKAHEEMEQGIANAKAYEARVRSLRLNIGLLTQEESNLRDAQDQATDLMGDQADALDRATQRAGIFRRSLRTIDEAFAVANSSSGQMEISIESLDSAMEAAAQAANGEVAALELSTRTFQNQEEAREALLAAQHLARQALNQEERAIRTYNKSLEKKQAMILIDQALRSDDIELMEEARQHIGAFQLEEMKLIDARIDAAIAAVQASEAADAEASALQRATKAATENTDATTKSEAARNQLLRMTAEATGEAAVINFEYAETIKEISRLVTEAGASEAEAALLITAATDKRTEALERLQEAENQYLTTKGKHAAHVVELEEDAATAIQAVYDNRMADLLMAKLDESITEEQFREQELKAEAQYQKQLNALRIAKGQQALQTASMVSDSFMNLIDSNINMISQRIDQEEEAALARAEGNLEAQEKIREDFDKKRKSELSESFEKRKQLEIVNAIISGASASIAALAPPPTGLGPVAGAFLVPAIATATGLQINQIAQQNPPFHQGGIVEGMGDQTITAQGGEVILNRSAVASLGGAVAADSLNNGGAAGGTVVVQMTYKQRVFDQVVVDNLAKGGPLRSALNKAQRRGRRGRVGGRL